MRIGQKIKDENFGTLTHGGGIISLAPSTVNIGGVQVDTDALSRTISSDVTLVANTLYMIYVVMLTGAPVIRISTNLNSVGPVGFSSWKLVGAFMSNGVTGSIAFGSFVNIEGAPKSNVILFTPVWTAAVNPSIGNGSIVGRYTLEADFIECMVSIDMGSTTTYGTNTWIINPPANMNIDSTKLYQANPGNVVGEVVCTNGSVANGAGASWSTGGNNIVGFIHGNLNNVQSNVPFVWANGNNFRMNFNVPIVGFSNTPIKDR